LQSWLVPINIDWLQRQVAMGYVLLLKMRATQVSANQHALG
jgi:hypothetical protein